MAKITRETIGEEDKTVEVKEMDHDDIIDKGIELGIIYGCIDGRCGSCRTEILEGEENLTEITQDEKEMGINEKEPYRLMCQCQVKSGLVKIRV